MPLATPMSLLRCLIPPLLILLSASAGAEQALQLSAELTSPPALATGSAPPAAAVAAAPSTPTLLPDPSREVKDELPAIPTIDLTTEP
ncbi:MAG: hypothetical protein K8R10_13905, partial [Rhodocyclales bacterium]|nr:hypothetical protein [Rhodocyclales bacterium]